MSYDYSILENCIKKKEELFKEEYLFLNDDSPSRNKWAIYERITFEILRDKSQDRNILNNQRLLNKNYDIIYNPKNFKLDIFQKYHKFDLLEAFALSEDPLSSKLYNELKKKNVNSNEYLDFVRNSKIPQKLFMRNMSELEYNCYLKKE